MATLSASTARHSSEAAPRRAAEQSTALWSGWWVARASSEATGAQDSGRAGSTSRGPSVVEERGGEGGEGRRGEGGGGSGEQGRGFQGRAAGPPHWLQNFPPGFTSCPNPHVGRSCALPNLLVAWSF